MSSFIPNLADHTAPLGNLVDFDFAWNLSHSKAFKKVKSLICTTTTLAYYDRNEPVALLVDASIKSVPKQQANSLSIESTHPYGDQICQY